MRRILAIADLDDDAIDRILTRAVQHADGTARPAVRGLLGLCFFETSLRTRVGFAAAAHRVGARPVEVLDRRASARSMPESLEDTVRTVSGYCDALVVRSPRPASALADASRLDVAWLNAGDDREHPSQALVDLFAIERLLGPIGGVRLAVCGDLRMRAARSLLALLARRPPAELVLVTDESLGEAPALPPALAAVTRSGDLGSLPATDALYAVGIPHGAADESVRSRLRIDRAVLAGLRADAAVLSPLPVIDEIASGARTDPRMRFFEQSDLGLFVRMALVELLLE